MVCLFLLAGAPLALPDPGASLSADTGWQSLDDRNGVALFSRTRVGSQLKEFKGTGVIDAPPGAVQKVLEDVANYPKFMPYVAESRTLSQEGAKVVAYERLNVPFVANRDYTVQVENGTATGPNGETIYRDSWQTDNEAGPAPRHGVVRVRVNEGSWLLEPAGPGGQTTQATYQIYTDSGGMLPAFLANKASQLIIPKLFEAIRKQAREAK